jgi:hypothetical protein
MLSLGWVSGTIPALPFDLKAEGVTGKMLPRLKIDSRELTIQLSAL